jgi:hypothetical protein
MKITFFLLLLSSLFYQCDNQNMGDCSVPATVRDLTGLDGCGFVLELTDGTKLLPQQIIRCGTPPQTKEMNDDPLLGFEFIDGKKVRISYEKINGQSICMAGPMVKITCIEEVTSIPEE